MYRPLCPREQEEAHSSKVIDLEFNVYDNGDNKLPH